MRISNLFYCQSYVRANFIAFNINKKHSNETANRSDANDSDTKNMPLLFYNSFIALLWEIS